MNNRSPTGEKDPTKTKSNDMANPKEPTKRSTNDNMVRAQKLEKEVKERKWFYQARLPGEKRAGGKKAKVV